MIQSFTSQAHIPQEVREYAWMCAVSGCNSYVDNIDSVIFGGTEEPVIRRFAFKCTKKRGLELMEVERTLVIDEEILICQHAFEWGYYYGWKPWYNCNNEPWFEVVKASGVYSHMLNLDRLFDFPQYKYCGYKSQCGDLADYLFKYLNNPGIEFFGKLGLVPHPSWIKKATKDGQFARFLRDNAKEYIKVGYSANVMTCAYSWHVSLKEAYQRMEQEQRIMKRTKGLNIPRNLKAKVFDYLKEEERKMREEMSQNGCCHAAYYISPDSIYKDYFHACEFLGLDMNDTKNLLPNDLNRMHDLRIDEMNSIKKREDQKKREELCRQFSKVAAIYIPYEVKTETYSIIIPRQAYDLVVEGQAMENCVGKMGYDLKMSEHRTVIAFLRKTDEINKSFVTMEFDPKRWELLQCYAKHNSRPDEEVLQFAKEWLKEVKRHEMSRLREGTAARTA